MTDTKHRERVAVRDMLVNRHEEDELQKKNLNQKAE